MERAYKYRIYPTRQQENLINQIFGCCRFVYNYYLNERQKAYLKDGTSMSYNDCASNLTILKKSEEHSFLKDADSTALQSSLKSLDSAFDGFFRRVKSGKKPGYPKFKSKRSHKQSYTTKNNGSTIKIVDNKIQLPKVGKVKIKLSRPIDGKILSATVSRSASGKCYVSLCCRVEKMDHLPKTDAVVGLDVGIKDFAISSDHERFENHKYLRTSEKRLAKLQRKLAKQELGSSNWHKTRKKIASLHEKIANQRSDFLHKLSAYLVRKYDIVCLEDLAPSNMVRNHHLAKSISDASWSEFARQLVYKADWYGKTVVKIDRFYPSSQLCSHCGAKWSGTKDLKVRKWTCPACGASLDRDYNAAINILIEGLRILNRLDMLVA
jgi:putative transposase